MTILFMLDLSAAFDSVENNPYLHNPEEIGLHSTHWVPVIDEKLFRKYKIYSASK